MLDRYDYGILGVGEIGAAIVTGLCEGTDHPASILLSPLSYYFQVFLRGRPFNERRVLDVMASAWMAIMADISESHGETAAD